MKASPAFQFYPADFLIGTADMTNEEVGIYIRLLSHQWAKGPLDASKVSRLIGCEVPKAVLEKFQNEAGRMSNVRLEEERDKQAKYREERSRSGKAGAESRWTRPPTTNGNTMAEPMAEPSIRQWQNDGSSSSVFNLQTSHSSSKKEAQGAASPPRSFVKPSVEQVRAYCVERSNSVDAEAFVDFYESKGWKIGKEPMRDWKAAVRTREKREPTRPNGARPGFDNADPRGNFEAGRRYLEMYGGGSNE